MSEIRKRKKGQMLSSNERQLILNLMSYLKSKNSDKSVSEIIREISEATGCSERTIYKIKKEASKGITVAVSKTRQRKKENKNSRNVKYDSFVKSSIRKKIHGCFLQNNPPTLNTILCLVNSDPNLPNFKRSTLHTLLKEIGFVYEQKGKKSFLTENTDSVKCRRAYLRDVRKFRSENRWIIYTGETLISLMKKEVNKEVPSKRDVIVEEKSSMACQAVGTVFVNASELMAGAALVYAIDSSALGSVEGTGDSMGAMEGTGGERNAAAGLDDRATGPACGENADGNGFDKKSSRELRLMVMHAGSCEGFVQGADFVSISKRQADDAENYKHWFLEKLLPKIPPNSVVVTDNNAAYHRAEGNYPDNSWKKQQIKNWLLSRSVKVEHLRQKKELLSVVKEVLPMFSTSCRMEEMARERGIIILSLPPFHYELNPLNMVWAQIKYHVKSNMRSLRIRKVKELIREGFYSVSQVNWMNYVEHVKEMEELLWALDEIQERNLPSIGQMTGGKETKIQENFHNL